MRDENCIFCKIAAGEIPAKAVYEDDLVMAFDDLSPQAPVHTLIIPKEHFGHLGDDVPKDVVHAIFDAVPKVASVKNVAESGYRVIVNSGPDAAQTIQHLHAHVLGGAPMVEGMVNLA